MVHYWYKRLYFTLTELYEQFKKLVVWNYSSIWKVYKSKLIFFAGGGKDVWIGLNDMREENLFEWARGDRVKYTNWNLNQPRQPSNQEQDCVMINPQVSHT